MTHSLDNVPCDKWGLVAMSGISIVRIDAFKCGFYALPQVCYDCFLHRALFCYPAKK